MRFVLLFLFWPIVALADPLPALFDVTGVAADDMLNVRAQPSGSADKRGALAHNAQNIEVTVLNDAGTWGRINLDESHGWVSMRYLTPHPPNEDYTLPQRLSCFGTEPFWSADFVQGQRVTFSTPEKTFETPGAGLVQTSRSRPDRYVLGFGNNVAMLRQDATCSDGMSDRLFGLAIDVQVVHGGDTALYSGCCSVLP